MDIERTDPAQRCRQPNFFVGVGGTRAGPREIVDELHDTGYRVSEPSRTPSAVMLPYSDALIDAKESVGFNLLFSGIEL